MRTYRVRLGQDVCVRREPALIVGGRRLGQRNGPLADNEQKSPGGIASNGNGIVNCQRLGGWRAQTPIAIDGVSGDAVRAGIQNIRHGTAGIEKDTRRSRIRRRRFVEQRKFPAPQINRKRPHVILALAEHVHPV